MQVLRVVFGVLLMTVEHITMPTGSDDKCTDILSLHLPYECGTNSLCTVKPIDYPQECIDNLLIEKEFEVTDDQFKISEDSAIPRDGSDGYNDNDCKRNSNNAPIYQIRDKKGDIRLVVQSPVYFQLIEQEVCEETQKQLQDPTEHFSLDELNKPWVQVFSDQIRLDFNFLVLSHNGTGVELAQSKDGVPVACTCRAVNV